jgi:hypothetical protein
VRARLELIEAMVPLNTRLEPQYGGRGAVRVRLHTGLVVIGEMGGGSRQEQLAMGDENRSGCPAICGGGE